jgi:hypothetical protein
MNLTFFRPKCALIKFNNIKPNILPYINLSAKLFSTTLIRKADPLSTTVLSFATPYGPGVLYSPIGAAFIVLVGMATTLYC